MKTTLEFTLPEESEEYDLAFNGHKYARVLEEFDEWLRQLSKYQSVESVAVGDARDKLREIKIDVFS